MESPARAIIKLGYSCNNRCLFCHALPKRPGNVDLSTEQARSKILEAASIGTSQVLFSGGEPTLRKDLQGLMVFAKENGMSSGLVTNARLLKYKGLLGEFRASGLSYVYASLHGPCEVHDRTVRTESFLQTLDGVRNVSAFPDIELVVNCVVSRTNARSLRGLVDALEGIPISRLKFSLMEPVRGCEEITPRITDAWDSVRDAMNHAARKGIRPGQDGFPECVTGPGHPRQGLRASNILFISEAHEEGFFPTDSGNTVQGETCHGCPRSRECPGTFREYLDGLPGRFR